MTKKELIEALADYPDDTELFVENDDDKGGYTDIYHLGYVVRSDDSRLEDPQHNEPGLILCPTGFNEYRFKND